VAGEDVRRLLERASEGPLGPLSLGVTGNEDNAWQVSVTWYGSARAAVTASYDGDSDVLRLETAVPTSAPREAWQPLVLTRPWVIDGAQVPGGGLAVRLWLRGEGLDLNTLLAAIADLARLGPALDAAAPPSAPTPAPAPVAASMPSLPPAEPAPPPPDTPAAPEPAESPPPPRPASGPKPEPWEVLSAAPASTPASAVPAPASPDSTMEAAPMPQHAEAAPPTPEPAPEPVPATTPGHCRECGAAYLPDHVFCTNCGARLN
jgi:hypothetical protein